MRIIKTLLRSLYRRPELTMLEKPFLLAIGFLAKPFIVDTPKRMAYLEFLQSRGVSLLPARYFEPVPLVSNVRRQTQTPALIMRDWTDTDIDTEIEKIIGEPENLAALKNKFSKIADNHMFNSIDIIACHTICKRFAPKRVVEIGSGYSTYVLHHSTAETCTITSIEPYPSDFMQRLASEHANRICLIEQKAEDFHDETVFTELEANDILFIDSTHVCVIGGDLPAIFGRILPRLKKGVIVHVHDIALPYEYPATQAYKSGRFYNEQYLLSPLVEHGCYTPIFSTYRFLVQRARWLKEGVDRFTAAGSSFWMIKN